MSIKNDKTHCDCHNENPQDTARSNCSCHHSLEDDHISIERKHNSCGCGCCEHPMHDKSHREKILQYGCIAVAIIMLFIGIMLEKVFKASWFLFPKGVAIIYYLIAFLLIASDTLISASKLIFTKANFFNELVLMSIASIGAFILGDYHEAILLMLLYYIGELLEEKASEKSHRNISKLIDNRPTLVRKIESDGHTLIDPSTCAVEDKIYILPGERVALDGVVESENAILDCSALTGESLPVELEKGDSVAAGSIVLSQPLVLTVSKPFNESSLARILKMVEDATERKPKAERFIRRFAKIYTPIVFALSTLIVIVPILWDMLQGSQTISFHQYVYNGLVFLVTSCPCAFVISIPLGYFSGLGAASRNGLLIKGGLYLERMAHLRTVLFDKTGTLTKGKFSVFRTEVFVENCILKRVEPYVMTAEKNSTHPIAKALSEYFENKNYTEENLSCIKEIPGKGIVASTDKGEKILIGNKKLFDMESISVNILRPENMGETAIHVAIDQKHIVSYLLSDQVKETSKHAVEALQSMGVEVAIYSGDKDTTVKKIGKQLGVDTAIGELLPEDKIAHAQELGKRSHFAFVGDGINDAPVMALSDVGFAMGGIGSEAAIEAADVVIASDDPRAVPMSLAIATKTRWIIIENIVLSLGIKLFVMTLAVLSMGSLIFAIIADVGATLLAIGNSMRLLHIRPTKNI